jgi:UDP-N-acetylglucosamine 4,6-dehydratase
MFEQKTLLVTGGTGSFGNEVVETLVAQHPFKQVIIFSRDEKKQNDMRLRLNHPKLKFVIGDVRDRDRVFSVMSGVDYIFHAAALKSVPACEFHPMEAFKTNVMGTQNVLDAAEFHGVERMVVLSTDKAVYPINAMGMSKAMMEKLVIAKSREAKKTIFCAVRYGNVMYSRGSVIPLFVSQILENKNLTVTHPDMTRFLLPLPFAVDLVLYALKNGASGDLFVKKAPASTAGVLAQACLNIFGSSGKVHEIGIREGEKMHETLIAFEEGLASEDLGDYFRIRAERSESYDHYFTQGQTGVLPSRDYTSENTEQLTVAGVEKLLLSLKEIQYALATRKLS